MELEKAIVVLGLDKTSDFVGAGRELEDALQLGIEALKYIKDFRLTVDGKPIYQLPGETKD